MVVAFKDVRKLLERIPAFKFGGFIAGCGRCFDLEAIFETVGSMEY